MREFIFFTLIVAAFAFPGRVEAQSVTLQEVIETPTTNDPALVDRIMHHLAQSYGYDYADLFQKNRDGKLQVQKTTIGYEVHLQEANGGVIISIIENI